MKYTSDIKPVHAVKHALELFEVFKMSSNKQEFGVTELAKILGLHKNNVFRILATLSTEGYIEQNTATENYRLGIKIFNLGQKFISKLGYLKLAKPFMERLKSELNETVYIGILRKDAVVYLDIAESDNSVRIASRLGKDIPAHCTSIGKVQLAYMSNDELNSIYTDESKFIKYTENSILSLSELKKVLEDVLVNEYAIDNQEFEKDVACFAVPIKDYKGRPVAALSVASPVFRLSEDRIFNEIIPTTKRYAKEISQRLGYQE